MKPLPPTVPMFSPRWKALKALLDPATLAPLAARVLPGTPFWLREALDAFQRPHYGYGLCQAARQAHALGISRISAIEFGVGAGGGLLVLEQTADIVSRAMGVRIDVFGFDLGSGLPRPLDFRDSPYCWQAGHYRMDVDAVKRRLSCAELVLGDVAETVPGFLQRETIAPVGFIAFDLDFYTSTMAAFALLDGDPSRLLPRVLCYFDDIVGPDAELHNEHVGELLAIREFNASHETRKLSRIHGLAHKRVAPCLWSDQMYCLHLFDHPRYTDYVYPSAHR